MFEEVLDYWYGELKPDQWWAKDEEVDRRIAQRFAGLHAQAVLGELWDWRKSPRGRLAEILILDQFSRHLYRDSARAFAQDPMALVLAQEALSLGVDSALEDRMQRHFLYLPFMHSESRVIHVIAVDLFQRNGVEDGYQFELKHKAIIDRFGRYPHRNAVLGRETTAEEAAFLRGPDSSF